MLVGALASASAAFLLLVPHLRMRDPSDLTRRLGLVFDWDVTNEHWWWPALFWIISGFLALGLAGRLIRLPKAVLRGWAVAGVVTTLVGLAWLSVFFESGFRKYFPPSAGGWGPGEARIEFLWPMWSDMLLHAAAAFASSLLILLISRRSTAP